MEVKSLYKEESHGGHGAFFLEINVGATKLPDLHLESIREASYAAAGLIRTAVRAAALANDPDAQARRQKERASLVGLFQQPIFVEEIPNGYCSDWCCKHLPWFIVTTTIGRIKIGWRKRVILIDWSETTGKTSDELFASEDVTKDTRMIHAWDYEAAQRYINAIMGATP